MASVVGPWDVDNDNDGTPDSVWVDLGFSVQTTTDGRRYKPLFAIYCIDLDGKLNLNAHGGISHLVDQGNPIQYNDGGGAKFLFPDPSSPQATVPETARNSIGFPKQQF